MNDRQVLRLIQQALQVEDDDARHTHATVLSVVVHGVQKAGIAEYAFKPAPKRWRRCVENCKGIARKLTVSTREACRILNCSFETLCWLVRSGIVPRRVPTPHGKRFIKSEIVGVRVNRVEVSRTRGGMALDNYDRSPVAFKPRRRRQRKSG